MSEILHNHGLPDPDGNSSSELREGSPSEFALSCLTHIRRAVPHARQAKPLLHHYLSLISQRMDTFQHCGSYLTPSTSREGRIESFIPQDMNSERLDFSVWGFPEDEDSEEYKRIVNLTYLTEREVGSDVVTRIGLSNRQLPNRNTEVVIESQFVDKAQDKKEIDAYLRGEQTSLNVIGKLGSTSLMTYILIDSENITYCTNSLETLSGLIPDPQDVISGRFFPSPDALKWPMDNEEVS